jgi:hypothetical protein
LIPAKHQDILEFMFEFSTRDTFALSKNSRRIEYHRLLEHDLAVSRACLHFEDGLIRGGVPRRQAIRHARSRKGTWHMAKTIASGVGMTNAWLALQGVVSLKSL